MRRAMPILVALLIPTVTTCGGSDSMTGPQPPAVTSVTVEPGTSTLEALGATTQFSATARDASGKAITGRSFTWTSSNNAVAEVDATGKVTALSNGSATIRAETGGIQGQSMLTVEQTVASVQVSVGKSSLTALGESTTATAAALDARGNAVAGRDADWTSESPEVATIDASGIITAVSNGTTTIDGAVDGKSGSTTVMVNQTGNALVITSQPRDGVAGQSLATQPVVEIRDANGNVVSDDNATEVTTSVASGGGTLLGTTTITATSGVATFTDIGIGGLAGSKTLAFSADGTGSATSEPFALAPGALSSLIVQSGDDQTQPAGEELPSLLAVKASDDWNNGIAGAAVQWSVTGGEGSLSDVASTTDAAGLATAVYTLGAHAGTETIGVELSAVSGTSVEFTQTATPNGTISGTVTTSNALMSVASARSGANAGDHLSQKIRPLNYGAGAAMSVARTRDSDIIENELIVQLRSSALNAPGVGSFAYTDRGTASAASHSIRTSLTEMADREGGHVVATLPVALGALVRLPDAASAEALKARLAANPNVERVYHNSRVWLFDEAIPAPQTVSTPDDPYSPWQAWHYEMADVRRAWDYTTGSQSVVVAVVDDGTRFDHPDLAPNLTSDGYDFVSPNSVPLCGGGVIDAGADGDGWDPDPTKPLMGTYNDALGCFDPGTGSLGSHGVHVAGTIGARGNDGYGVAGVSWNVSIRPVRVIGVTGSGNNFDIAMGIAYAAGYAIEVAPGEFAQASGPADIINLSLGGPTDDPILHDAITAADAAGSLLVASAGNDGTTNPNYPAAYPEVLSVAAVGPDGQPASYTNLAPSVDLFAPGGDQADGGVDFGVISTDWDYSTGSPSFNYSDGTSMAAPHVSGVAVLLLAREPGLSPAQLKSRLINYASGGILNARNSITQSMSPVQNQFVHLYDATSGAPLATVQASGTGTFEFQFLPDGDYFLFAGQDEDGDGITGAPGRRWGANGGSSSPSSITVGGAGQYPASFTYGYPIELEPNDGQSDASFLALGGYTNAVTGSTTDVDVYTVTIPAAGAYTFRTTAVAGACGFALEEDTILELYDSVGGLIASNDDVDVAALDFCSRIETMLEPGTYYLAVSGYLGRPSRYAIESLF